MQPSLTDVLGPGATQDATTVTIQKSSLPTLTATANNTGESIIAGILLRAESFLTPARRDSDPDVNIAIQPGFDTTVTRGGIGYYQHSREITLQKINDSAAIDADNF